MEKEFLDILKNIEGNLSNNDILQEIATTLNNIEATLTSIEIDISNIDSTINT
ncbi:MULTISPECIES: hypothetical protein [Vagococcus]|uniref:hypothetical protein n=1 Tax=Vagococcus TaxID=2737 RepID=UPI001314BF2E|nr:MULTISPECIES: hypothetical protein [Vagococcus]